MDADGPGQQLRSPGLATARFGTVVTATLPSSIIVERAMYWDAAGGTWDAGTNAVAMPIP